MPLMMPRDTARERRRDALRAQQMAVSAMLLGSTMLLRRVGADPDARTGWKSLRAVRMMMAVANVPRRARMSEEEHGPQPPTIDDLLDNPGMAEKLFDLLRMDRETFNALLELVRPGIESPRATTAAGRVEPKTTGRDNMQSTRHRLFMFLVRLRGRGTYLHEIAPMARWLARSTISRDFNHVARAIALTMSNTVIRWPDRGRRAMLASLVPGLPGCIGAVDGTEIGIRLPGNLGRRYAAMSGKKGKTTIIIQMIVDHFGNILHLSGGGWGANVDVNLWRDSSVGIACEEGDATKFFDEGQWVCADCGYGVFKHLCSPYTAPEMRGGSTLAMARTIFSNVLRRFRAIVEHVFRLVKGRYTVLQGESCLPPPVIMLLFRVAATLLQWQRQRDGIVLRPGIYFQREDMRETDWDGALFTSDMLRRGENICTRLLRLIGGDTAAGAELFDRIARAGEH